MGMDELERAFRIVEESDLADFDGPPEGDVVNAAEEALGVRLPPTHKRFLNELGVGGIGSEEIYGVIGSNL